MRTGGPLTARQGAFSYQARAERGPVARKTIPTNRIIGPSLTLVSMILFWFNTLQPEYLRPAGRG